MSDETDAKTLNDVQERFKVDITELPDEIDLFSYIPILVHKQEGQPVAGLSSQVSSCTHVHLVTCTPGDLYTW